ncbi:hypothetical protein [Streptomyces tailanensis]|uniref:hypothetical protein n=1 Tax=Streptomyces tailanensis TaxID=2569858 RepID=UPI00122E264E|nr:hypothetical protein [Streptomyces tailanensis]
MNSAPQIETAEISDAALDNISGGLNPHVSVAAGTTTISDADVLAQVGAVQDTVLSTVGHHQVGVNVSI